MPRKKDGLSLSTFLTTGSGAGWKLRRRDDSYKCEDKTVVLCVLVL